MITWGWIASALAAFLFMRVGGLISNFWTALGVLGFLLILGLLQSLTAFRRFATAVFIIWAAFSFGLPMLAVAFRMDWPILAETWRRRALESELRAAEWMDPVGYRARVGNVRYCQEIDRIQGSWVAERYRELLRPLEPRRPGLLERLGIAKPLSEPKDLPRPDPEKERKLYEAQKLIEQHRLKCRAEALGAALKSPETPQDTEDWRERIVAWFTENRRGTFWLLVVVLIAGALLAMVFQKLPVWSGVKIVAMVVLAALLADWVLWGPAEINAREWLGKAPARAPLAREYIRLEVKLKEPPEWTDIHHHVIPCVPITFDTSAVRDPWIRFADGGEERLGRGREFGWRTPVALRGWGVAGLVLEEKNRNCRRPPEDEAQP